MNLILLHEKDFIADNLVKLSDYRFKHIENVIKVHKGDILKVGLLGGKIGIGTIADCDKDSVTLSIKLTNSPPSANNKTIILALPRPKAFRRMIMHIITLGFKHVYVINSWKVEKSFWTNSLLENNQLHKEIITGLEQAVDTIPAQFVFKKLFKPFVEDDLPGIIAGKKAVVFHPGENSFKGSLSDADIAIIGPDGGFTEYEIGKFIEAGCEICSLGDRILRTETAIPYISGLTRINHI